MLVMERKAALTERRPHLTVTSAYEAELRVKRTDILFEDLPGDRVRIRVTVHNAGAERSQRTTMRLESAPLGAFVSWRPLTTLSVPPLEPGESRELSTEVMRPRPVALGNFNRVPPRTLLTALNSPDESAPPKADRVAPRNSALMAWLEFMRSREATRSSGVDLPGKRSLAPSLWDLLGREQPHWAGNINVFIGNHPVERHLAKALRVYPGRTNLAMFVVGDQGRRDAYAFEVTGVQADWQAALCDATNCRSLVIDSSNDSIEEREWVQSNGGLLVMLATHPPGDCSEGNMDVHVTRRSDRKTAIVEFNLDPAAQGTGCYFV